MPLYDPQKIKEDEHSDIYRNVKYGRIYDQNQEVFRDIQRRKEMKESVFPEVRAIRDKLTMFPAGMGGDMDEKVEALGLGGIGGTIGGAGSKYGQSNIGTMYRQEARRFSGWGMTKKQTMKMSQGWYQSKDGWMKFEIDDSAARIKNLVDDVGVIDQSKAFNDVVVQRPWEKAARLEDVLDHPALFEQYPHLKDTMVVLNRNLDDATQGAFHAQYPKAKHGFIDMNPNLLNQPKKFRSTLLHEIQHALQQYEGFAVGGSPNLASTRAYKLRTSLKEAEEMLANTKPGTSHHKQAQKMKGKIEKELQKYGDDDFEAYRKMFGEQESREVERRADWDMEKRLKSPPKEDPDAIFQYAEDILDPLANLNQKIDRLKERVSKMFKK
jgi:hypothetical protein